MRVLLVDDNEELREFLALSLTEASIEVVSAGNSAQAIKHLESDKFDAFVIDSFLGSNDGLSLVSELRATKSGRAVPVLLMSSLSTALARRMAQDAGCDEFLVKPFGQTQFIEQVRALERVRR